MPEPEPPRFDDPEPSGEEVLFALIREAAVRVETPVSGLRAAVAVLCARPSQMGAADEADIKMQAERIRVLLRQGVADQPEPPYSDSSDSAEAWITLERPVEEPGTPLRRLPDPAERGLKRMLPRRRGLLLLLVLSGIAAYIANSKGCAFF